MAYFAIFFSQNAWNIYAESVPIRKFLRWVLLASEHAPASPTSTASPLTRASPFTATLQNSRCRERITFPIRKFFCSYVVVYQKRLSLPFGVDDSIAADYLCQQKKAMKNGKHKTNSFNSSNSWSKKQSSLPSLQGGAGGRLFPSRSTVNPQDWCFKCFGCFRCFRCFISLLDQKIARFWSKSEQNRCFKCFSCSKCSAILTPFPSGRGRG